MKNLNENEKKILLEMLLEDMPFVKIKERLGLHKNYNLKAHCEYLGHKYKKAFEMHINNFKDNTQLAIQKGEVLNKEDFIKGLDLIINQIKFIEQKNNNQLDYKNKEVDRKEDIVELIELPSTLPLRLQGENYEVKQTSIKVIANVWEEFQHFVKNNKRYNSIEYISLALLEFLEKYRVN